MIVYGEILDEKESQIILKFYDKCIRTNDFTSKLHLRKPICEVANTESKELRFSNVSVCRKKSFQV